LQETLTQDESQLGDLKIRLEYQEAETRKADAKFKFSLDENEKLKTGFSAERSSWAEEKAALLKRAEDAEAALKPVTEELSGLKRQINSMTAAIFGK
jgi:hypothetical protein